MIERLTHVYQAADKYDGGFGPVYPTLAQAQEAAQASATDDYADASLTWEEAEANDPAWPAWILMAGSEPTPVTVYRFPVQYQDA